VFICFFYLAVDYGLLPATFWMNLTLPRVIDARNDASKALRRASSGCMFRTTNFFTKCLKGFQCKTTRCYC